MDFGTRVNTWWSRKWLDTLLESADEQTVLQGMRFVERGQVTSIDIIDTSYSRNSTTKRLAYSSTC